MMGLARTGSSFSNGSGDFAIAFSTSPKVRRLSATLSPAGSGTVQFQTTELQNDDVSPLFEAVIEATEEAIYNSLFMATSVTYRGRTADAIPLDKVREILDRYHVGKR
jgi:D-aminopeptidase